MDHQWCKNLRKKASFLVNFVELGSLPLYRGSPTATGSPCSSSSICHIPGSCNLQPQLVYYESVWHGQISCWCCRVQSSIPYVIRLTKVLEVTDGFTCNYREVINGGWEECECLFHQAAKLIYRKRIVFLLLHCRSYLTTMGEVSMLIHAGSKKAYDIRESRNSNLFSLMKKGRHTRIAHGTEVIKISIRVAEIWPAFLSVAAMSHKNLN